MGFRNGFKQTGWKQKISAGISAGLPYSADFYSVVTEKPHSYVARRQLWNLGPPGPGVPSLLHEDDNFSSGYHMDHQLGTLTHAVNIAPEAEAQVLSKIYDRLRAESSTVNGLLVTGELRKTLQLLTRPFSSIRSSVLHLAETSLKESQKVQKTSKQKKSETARDFRRRKAQIIMNGISGTWLEVRFGLMPTISDVEGICKAANRYIDPLRTKRSRIHATSPANTALVWDNPSSLVFSYTTMQYIVSSYRSSSASIRYDVGLKHVVSGPPQSSFSKIAELSGFSLENFVPTIWELVPWSFLIDYVTNVGDILSAVTTNTSAVSWISRTLRQDTYSIFTGEAAPYSEPGNLGSIWSTKSIKGDTKDLRVFRHLTFTRSIPTSLGTPKFYFSLPPTSSIKYANVLALVDQVRSSNRQLWRR